jgi:AraC-like DNA-binding protein
MVSNRCKIAVKEELKKLGLHFIVVDLGEVEIMENLSVAQREQVRIALQSLGLELMDDKRAIMIEKIKNVITEMIHYSDETIKTNYSDYISEKLNYSSVAHLSNQFKKITGLSPSHFKQLKNRRRNPIEDLGNKVLNIKSSDS